MTRSIKQAITIDGKAYTRSVFKIKEYHYDYDIDSRQLGWVRVNGYLYLVERTYKWKPSHEWGAKYYDENWSKWTQVYTDGAPNRIACRPRARSVKLTNEAQAWLRDLFVATAIKCIGYNKDATATDVYFEAFKGMSCWSSTEAVGRKMPAELESLNLWYECGSSISRPAMVSRIKRVLDNEVESGAGLISRWYTVRNGKEILAYCAPPAY